MIAIAQYGDGLDGLEAMATKCGKELLQKFKDNGNKAFDPRDLIRICVTNVIMNLTYGEVSIEDVDELQRKGSEIETYFAPAGLLLLLDIFPPLRYVVPPIKTVFGEMLKVAKEFHSICDRLTQIRLKKLENSEPECFIDHFLNCLDKNLKTPKLLGNNAIEYADAYYMGVDMVFGGFSTTSNLLHILLGILVNHPEIQDKAYGDIMSVLGDKTPTIEDRSDLPYIEALILEALRYSTFGPFIVPHYSKKETCINGYLIPEKSIIFPNIWNLHRDERYWEDPWVFNPMRFIEYGEIVPPYHKNRRRVLLFGAGRRHCAGEKFAKNRLFLLLTMLLQKFKFLPAVGFPKPKHDPHEYESHLTLRIKPYHLCVQERN